MAIARDRFSLVMDGLHQDTPDYPALGSKSMLMDGGPDTESQVKQWAVSKCTIFFRRCCSGVEITGSSSGLATTEG